MKSRYLTDEELTAVFAVLEPQKRLLYDLTLNTGLRIGDVVKARKSDFCAADNGIMLMRYVAEKTGKRGTAVLPPELARRIAAAPKGRRGYLFPSRTSRSGHITRQAAWKWFKAAGKAAGVSLDGCSPHALRKVYAVKLRHERGIAAAQKALQHDRESTTAIYAFSDVYAGKAENEPILWRDVDELVNLVAERLSEQKKC